MIFKLILNIFPLMLIIYAEITDSVFIMNVTEQNTGPDAPKPVYASGPDGDATILHWPLAVVPYYIDHLTYDKIISRRVRMAMQTIQDSSCVVFRQLQEKPVPGAPNGSWLHFTNPSQERECMHDPIFGTDEEIKIVLGFECMHTRDILHALLHAIGFRDEVSHPQRDQYIRVLWENVQPKYRPLFRIQNEVPQKSLVEYDPLSIMHFHDRAYSSNGGATVAPLIPGLIINPSENLSQLDKMKLRMYFSHDCNKRTVGDLMNTCKNVLYEGENRTENGNDVKLIPDDGENASEEEAEPDSDEEYHDNTDTNSYSDGHPNKIEDNESERTENASEGYTISRRFTRVFI